MTFSINFIPFVSSFHFWSFILFQLISTTLLYRTRNLRIINILSDFNIFFRFGFVFSYLLKLLIITIVIFNNWTVDFYAESYFLGTVIKTIESGQKIVSPVPDIRWKTQCFEYFRYFFTSCAFRAIYHLRISRKKRYKTPTQCPLIIILRYFTCDLLSINFN